MSLAMTEKRTGRRSYPMCGCGKPATEKVMGEWMCNRCAKLAAIRKPKGGRK